MNLLFICSRNQWQSSTTEAIYKQRDGLHVRSAGTEPSARVKLNEKMISWADLIFLMEKRHKERMLQQSPELCRQKQIIILDIANEYQYMDEELVGVIKLSVDPYLDR